MLLKSERLHLREMRWDDLPAMFHLHRFPEVAQYNTIGIPKSIEDTRRIIRRGIDDQEAETRKHYAWVILESRSKLFIGEAGMNLSADRFKLGEIYYNLLPDSWGKGYATELAKRMIKFGFEELGLHRISAGVATENKRSIRVLEKIGMTFEGKRRKILPINGEWKDNFHYAILEDDPRNY